MKFVEPITDKNNVRKIRDLMIQDGKKILALLFWTGCYTGLRISDLLKLTFEDYRKNVVIITEQKTGKERRIAWHKDIKELFNSIDKGQQGNVFISKSNRNKGKVWSSVYTGNSIKEYCEQAGLEGRFNNHTLRKTFAYRLYKSNNNDLVLVQDALNHSKLEITRRYLGSYAKETNEAISNINF